jgi:ATP-binding cassette, subfamily F, member 3
MLLSCQNISKSFGADTILSDVSFLINETDKCALVGVNGAGKTTVFKIITGELTHDSGEFIVSKNCTLGYLTQISTLNETNTIYDEMLTVFKEVIETENKMRILENEMSLTKDYILEEKLKAYDILAIHFENLNGYEYKSRIRGVIKGLGFNEEEFSKEISSLSGGQKTRIALGKTLLTEPDLLLLDEPTNHLDISSIEWLEKFLKNYPKSVLIISHDRYFLNNTIDKIIEIEHKKSTIYFGDYNYFTTKKAANYDLAMKNYLNQRKDINEQEESIRKLKSYNREKSVKRAESKEKMLDKVVLLDKPLGSPSTMNLSLKPQRESGHNVLDVLNVSQSFDTLLFENISFSIVKGEKVALIGANGIGKTTLFKILLNLIKSTTGTIKLGTGVSIGYYDQEQRDLNVSNTIYEEIMNCHPELTNLQIRSSLAAFMFNKDDINKKISSLSGGEKGRVAFVKIMLSEANFLLLDEPTNHLDLFSKEILENAINSYTGTVLYISHDRYFINNTANRIIDIHKQGADVYLGNYDYYVAKKHELSIEESSSLSFTTTIQNTHSKDEWLTKKKDEADIRKNAAALSKTEDDISSLEEQISQLDTTLSLPENASDMIKLQQLYNIKDELVNQLDTLYELWETFHEK